MSEKIEIDGLKELEKTLREIGPQVKGNQLRTAVRAGMANQVVADAKRRAPVKSGRLRNAIVKKLIPLKERDKFTRSGDSFEGYDIGVNLGRNRRDPKGAWYWWFIEAGTDGAVAGSRKGTSSGAKFLAGDGIFFGKAARGQPARPFLRPALEENRRKLVDDFTGQLDRVLKLAAKKLAKHPK